MSQASDSGEPRPHDEQPNLFGNPTVPTSSDLGQRNEAVNPEASNQGKDGGLRRWLGHLWSRDPDRQLELILALAIATFALCQLVVTIINNVSTSKQVEKIIGTAARIQDSASQITQASWRFSGAAQGINSAGWNAVGKLQGQVEQVARSAKAAENSIKATQGQMRTDLRPWVGLQTISCSSCNARNIPPPPEAARVPGINRMLEVEITNLGALLVNTGKTPAEDVKIDWRIHRGGACPAVS